MRLQLTLQHSPNLVLPVNYQYLISSWIYNSLNTSNSEYAEQLHHDGYKFGSKNYKLFTFGPLVPYRYYLNQKDRTFTLQEGPTKVQLSFLINETAQHFIMGLFKGQCFELRSGKLGGKFKVIGVDVLPKPKFQATTKFSLLTPICISKVVDHSIHGQYQSPKDEDYSSLLINNLLRKQNALRNRSKRAKTPPSIIETLSHSFKVKSAIKRRPRFFKGKKHIAYQFDFELEAPLELLELGFYAGFGEKNSGMGLGMTEVKI